MNLEQVLIFTAAAQQAREDELDAKLKVPEMKEIAEREKAVILNLGLGSGAIDGKNAETRNIQIAGLLLGNENYQKILAYVAELEFKAARATIRRQRAEDELSIVRAYLYSLSGEKQ